MQKATAPAYPIHENTLKPMARHNAKYSRSASTTAVTTASRKSHFGDHPIRYITGGINKRAVRVRFSMRNRDENRNSKIETHHDFESLAFLIRRSGVRC